MTGWECRILPGRWVADASLAERIRCDDVITPREYERQHLGQFVADVRPEREDRTMACFCVEAHCIHHLAKQDRASLSPDEANRVDEWRLETEKLLRTSRARDFKTATDYLAYKALHLIVENDRARMLIRVSCPCKQSCWNITYYALEDAHARQLIDRHVDELSRCPCMDVRRLQRRLASVTTELQLAKKLLETRGRVFDPERVAIYLIGEMRSTHGRTFEIRIDRVFSSSQRYEAVCSCNACKGVFIGKPVPSGPPAGVFVFDDEVRLAMGWLRSAVMPYLEWLGEHYRHQAVVREVAERIASCAHPFLCSCVRDHLAERDRTNRGLNAR